MDLVVAREPELAVLSGFVAAASEGPARACFVSGEAGAGKSTLLAEFVRRVQGRDDRVLVAKGQCNAITGFTDAYLPLREALGSLAGGEGPTVGGDENRRRLSRGASFCLELVAEVGPGLVGLFVPPAAVALHGARWVKKRLEAEREAARVRTEFDQTRLFEEFTGVVDGLVGRDPLIMILEDLHWCDAASLALMFHVVRQVQRPGLLIVGTFRDEEVDAGRGGERHPLAKVLTELTRYQGDVVVEVAASGSGRAFVDALLEVEPNELGESFRAALTAVTEGQALFTTEIVRTMKADGRLVQGPRGWVESDTLDWSLVPARVEGVIEERVARLTTDERELLGAASVQGERFIAEIAADSSAMADGNAIRLLSRDLDRRHGLVSEVGGSRLGSTHVIEYDFSHALIQAWVYGDLSLGERRYLHASVAAAIDRLVLDDRGSVLGTLGYHYEQAGDVERARNSWRAAGDRASGLWLWEEARLALGNALRLTPEPTEDRVSLLWSYAQACMNHERLAEGRASGEEGLAIARSLGSPVSVPMMLSVLVFAGTWLDGPAGLLDDAHEAVDAADQSGSIAACALARSILADVLRLSGDWTAAVRAITDAVELTERAADFPPDWRAICLMNCGETLAGSGDTQQAELVYQKLERASTELGSRQVAAEAALGPTFILIAKGDVDGARSKLEDIVVDFGEFPSQPAVRARLHTMRGYCALLVGDEDLATESFVRAMEIYLSFKSPNPYNQSGPLLGLAELAEARGDIERAAELLGATHGKFYPAPLDFYRTRAVALTERLSTRMTEAEMGMAIATGRDPLFDPLAAAS